MFDSPDRSTRDSAPKADVDGTADGGMKVPDGIDELVHSVPSSVPPAMFEPPRAAARPEPPAGSPKPPSVRKIVVAKPASSPNVPAAKPPSVPRMTAPRAPASVPRVSPAKPPSVRKMDAVAAPPPMAAPDPIPSPAENIASMPPPRPRLPSDAPAPESSLAKVILAPEAVMPFELAKTMLAPAPPPSSVSALVAAVGSPPASVPALDVPFAPEPPQLLSTTGANVVVNTREPDRAIEPLSKRRSAALPAALALFACAVVVGFMMKESLARKPGVAAAARSSVVAVPASAPVVSVAPVAPVAPVVPSVETPPAAEPTAPTTAAPTAPSSADVTAASAVPPGMGLVKTAAASPGHRIFVDQRTLGQTPEAVLVKCGVHRVRVGSAGKTVTVDVPCGGEISVSDR